MYASGKSDGGIISMKRTNKGAQPEIKGQPPAEVVEKSPPAKGNCIQATVISTQRLKEASSGIASACASHADRQAEACIY